MTPEQVIADAVLNSRICQWCGIRIRWPWQHCAPCRQRLGDAGIYLQSGGPAFPYMSRLPHPAQEQQT